MIAGRAALLMVGCDVAEEVHHCHNTKHLLLVNLGFIWNGGKQTYRIKMYDSFFFLYYKWKTVQQMLLRIYFVGIPAPPRQNGLFQGFGPATPSCQSCTPESTRMRIENTHVNRSMFGVCNTQRCLTDLSERLADHLGDGV